MLRYVFKLVTSQLINLQGSDCIPELLITILDYVAKCYPKVFFEGFGGSGIVSINVVHNFSNVIVTWNDIDINIYSTLYCTKFNVNNFIERVDTMYRHLIANLYEYREVFEDIKKCLKQRDLSLYERGFWTIILYNCCVVCWKTQNMLRIRGKRRLRPTLELWHKLLQKIELMNSNFFDIWYRFNRSDVFMYLDPPHYTHETFKYGRYLHMFTLCDIKTLVDILKSTNANVLLKISRHETKLYNELLRHGYKAEPFRYSSHTCREHDVDLIFLKNF